MKTFTVWARPAFACGGVGIIFVSASGCGAILAEDGDDVSTEAAAQQAENGWDVGSDGRPLVFAGAQTTDAAGRSAWRDAMGSLPERLSPSSPWWQPFYAPALFQSLQAPRNDSLRVAMRPILTPQMAVAQRRGEALALGIPIVRDVALARGLVQYDVGEEVPEELYRAAAVVLQHALDRTEGTS